MQVAGVRLTCEGEKEFSAALRTAALNARRVDGELKKLTAAYGAGDKSAEYLTERQRLLNQRLEEQRRRTEILKRTRESYLAGGGADPAKLARLDEAIQKSEVAEAQLSRQIADCTAELDKQAAAAAKAANAYEKLSKAGKSLEKTGKTLSKTGKTLTKTVTLPLVAGLTAAGKAAMNFEDAFIGVRKTVDASEAEYAALKEGLIALSGEVPQTAVELAGLMQSAGQLGVPTKNLLQFTKATAYLEKSTNLSGESAATLLAQFANITKMPLDQIDRLGSVVVALGNTTATTEADIVALAQRLAGTGELIKLPEAAIVALSATMSSLGVEAQVGGSSMSKTFQLMQTAVLSGGKSLNNFAKVAGVSAKTFAAQWAESPLTALQSFLSGLKTISDQGGDAAAALKKAGLGDVRMTDVLLRMAAASGTLAVNLQTAFAAWEKGTALEEEGSKAANSTQSKWARTRNSIVSAGAALGETMLPHIAEGAAKVQQLAEGFRKLDTGTQSMIVKGAALTAAIGPVTKGLGGVLKVAGKLLPLLSGPAGLAVAGVAGITALGFALINANDPMKKLDASLRDLNVAADALGAEKITKAIQEATVAADRQVEVEIEIKARTTELKDQVEAIFADGKIAWKERKTLAQTLREEINTELAEARALLEARQKSIREMLDGLTKEDGTPLYTEEEKDALAAAAVSEVSGAIAELEGLQTDLTQIMNAIARNGGKASEEQLQQLNSLLDQIEAVKLRVNELGNETDDEGKQAYEVQKTGHGTPTTFAASLGYGAGQAETGAQRAEELRKQAEEAHQAAVLAAQSEEELAKADAAYQAALKRADEIAQAGEKTRDEIFAESWKGLEKSNQEGAQALEEASRLLSLATMINQLWENPDSPDAPKLREKIFSKENLEKYLQAAMQDILAAGLNPENLDPTSDRFDEALSQFMDYQLREAIAAALEGNEDALSPFATALQGMLDAGIDPESLDWSAFTESLRGAMLLHLVDDDQNGGLGALELPLAIKISLVDEEPESDGKGPEKVKQAAGQTLADAIAQGELTSLPAAEALRDKIAAALSDGSADGAAWLKAAGGIGDAIEAGGASALLSAMALRRQVEAILSGTNTHITLPGAGNGGSSPSPIEAGRGPLNPALQSDVNVFVTNANFGSRKNVEGFAAELSALQRSKLAGLGFVK